MKKVTLWTTTLVLMLMLGSSTDTQALNSNLITQGSIFEIAAPSSVVQGTYESNSRIFIFNEVQNSWLSTSVSVDISGPGTYNRLSNFIYIKPKPIIPANTLVNSYFVHLDPVGASPNSTVGLEGSVTFSGEKIIGVMVRAANLSRSDYLLGAIATEYPRADDLRGLEFVDSNPWSGRDMIIVDDDLRTLYVRLEASNDIDQIRVITQIW